jgi:hypothetical protein
MGLKATLVETSGMAVTLQYCSLSHCWGKQPFLNLTRNNYSSFLEDIDISLVPRTFQDAFAATHKLGFQFIWINSLCIIQDDTADWAEESGKMSSVYSNSTVNFAATSSKDGSAGLFYHRNPALSMPCTILLYLRHRLYEGSGSSFYLFKLNNPNLWTRQVERSPLAQRGWVTQEVSLQRHRVLR